MLPPTGDLLVQGGHTLLPARRVERADILVRDGRIAAVGTSLASQAPPETRRLEATGLTVVPGFIDLQCNGAGGIDLTAEPERLWDVAGLLPGWGVTSWLPTIVSAPAGIRDRARAALARGPDQRWTGAVPLGLHLEGPFLAPERRGAHPAAHLRSPDPSTAAAWSAADGVALVTLAPELPGAPELVRSLVARGVAVSAGHSSATTEETAAAVDAGIRSVTHLFNAMGPLHHRDPGLVGAALTDERLTVGLIADGLHVHPVAVALAARAAGDRLALVTDAVAALGAPPGPVQLGTSEAVAGPDGVRLADGTLAGSTLSMDRAVANLMRYTGCDLGRAVVAATSTPARLLGQERVRGAVAAGACGDLVLLDGTEVVATVVHGRIVHSR